MPPAKEPSGTKVKKPSAEDEASAARKAAHQHALQVKKDFRKLKAKAFAKKFDEELGKVLPAVPVACLFFSVSISVLHFLAQVERRGWHTGKFWYFFEMRRLLICAEWRDGGRLRNSRQSSNCCGLSSSAKTCSRVTLAAR